MAELSQKQSNCAFEHAYQSLLPELLALRFSELVPVNIGVAGAVTKALGIQPAMLELKDRITEMLPAVDSCLPERLVTHALALSHAQTLLLTASQGVDSLPSLAAEGKELRAILLADAQALIRRGLIDAEALRGLKTGKGFRNVAFDLQILVQLFRRCPAPSAGFTATRAIEIQRAEELAASVLTLLGRRKKLRASIEAAADMRRRAFTLFTRVYEEARRVVIFLRWYERDADQLVPLLHAKRNDRKPKETIASISDRHAQRS